MVGEGVLQECLSHPDIEKILVVNRRPCGVLNPKLTEVIHDNFFDISPIENQLIGYDACFYCIGMTSLIVKEPQYYNITFNLTLYIAKRLCNINPEMIFCYVSGFGANTPDKAKFMQARVKGMTEIDLFRLPFKKIYSFRPGLMKPAIGQKKAHKLYYLFNPFYSIFRLIMPGFILSLKDLGLAMINSVLVGYKEQILEVKDIVILSKNK
jgi:hypothetical protein